MNPAAVLTPVTGLEYWARLEPDRFAVVEDDREFSFGELAELVRKTAGFLASAGVVPGDVVAMSLRNSLEALTLPLAAAYLGAQISPISFRLRPRELSPMLARARPRVLVYGEDAADVLHGSEVPDETLLLAREELRAGVGAHGPLASRSALVSPSEPYTLMWTSGTGGAPKAVCGSLGARMNWVLGIGQVYRVSSADGYLAAMPMMHSAGLTFALAHTFFGARIHLLPRFEVEEVWGMLHRGEVTAGLFVPTMLQLMLAADPDPARKLPALRSVIMAGSRLRPELHARLLERFPGRLYNYYGSTESPSMTVLLPHEQADHGDSVGRPFLGVQLTVRNSRPVEGYVEPLGEIFAHNPFAMDGYLSPAGEGSPDERGWLRTGDLGWLDDDGYLHVVGRQSEVIISGGMNVSLPEVESVVGAHPSVMDVTVLGLADPVWGEAAAAVVVLASEVDQGDALADLDAYCRSELADYKRPRHWRLVDEIPRTASGKPHLPDLRMLFSSRDLEG